MLRRVALVRTDNSEERIASIIRMIRIDGLGTLAVTCNRSTLRSSETSVLTWVTRLNIPEDGFVHVDRNRWKMAISIFIGTGPQHSLLYWRLHTAFSIFACIMDYNTSKAILYCNTLQHRVFYISTHSSVTVHTLKNKKQKPKNPPCLSVRKGIIPTKRPQFVGQVRANFCE
jgi:hypothetical protein